MKNVIIIGANGRTAREIIPRLAKQDDVAFTLFLRRPERLADARLTASRLSASRRGDGRSAGWGGGGCRLLGVRFARRSRNR